MLVTDTIGVLLAGTHPWANSPFDSLVARTLLPIAHRPLISYGLAWLQGAGIREVAVCGNRESRLLQSRLARHIPLGLAVSYHEDPMPRGAAGSARDAALATQGQTFVIADGTSIPRVALNDVLLKHHTSGAAVTVVVNSEEKRNAALDVPSGIYVFSRRALEQVPAHGFCDIKETLIPKLYNAGERIVAYEAASATPRVMDAATYMAVNEWMIERLVSEGEEQVGYSRTTHGFIHRDAFIADDASIVGPVLVGPGARIESNAVVIGPTSIGREAIVERGALVSRSAVWRRSIVGEYSTADRCIVADDAIVSAGAAMFKDVIVPDRASALNIDWVARQTVVAPKTGAIEVGARLGRLVFGGSWSRFPAAQ